MQIKIAAVGKLKERYWTQGIDEYRKRLSSYARMFLNEVPDEKTPDRLSVAQQQQVKEIEGERLLNYIKPNEYVIALVLDGQAVTSEQFAQQLETLQTYGRSQVCFVIGGSLGLSDTVLARADRKLSLGNMTFPHQMVRLILVEQVYRAFRIIRGQPYHK